jgi:hypothetical protein
MQVIENEQVICVDVDDTLVLHKKSIKGDRTICITDPYDGSQRYLVVHTGHVKILKDRKSRGATIVVWSQNGWAWAKAVVVALNLQDNVDLIASKPIAIVDDKPASDWLAERIYLQPDSLYGKL